MIAIVDFPLQFWFNFTITLFFDACSGALSAIFSYHRGNAGNEFLEGCQTVTFLSRKQEKQLFILTKIINFLNFFSFFFAFISLTSRKIQRKMRFSRVTLKENKKKTGNKIKVEGTCPFHPLSLFLYKFLLNRPEKFNSWQESRIR